MQSAQFRVHRGSCDLVWVFGEPRLVCKCMVGYTLHRQTDTSTPTAGYRKKNRRIERRKKKHFCSLQIFKNARTTRWLVDSFQCKSELTRSCASKCLSCCSFGYFVANVWQCWYIADDWRNTVSNCSSAQSIIIIIRINAAYENVCVCIRNASIRLINLQNSYASHSHTALDKIDEKGCSWFSFFFLFRLSCIRFSRAASTLDAFALQVSMAWHRLLFLCLPIVFFFVLHFIYGRSAVGFVRLA